MPIISSDILLRLSGGAANASPSVSLGGVKSSVAASQNLFDNVFASEAASGDIEYRCVYVHNSHATLSFISPVVWIYSDTISSDTSVAIGIGTSAVDATEQTVANESTAPSGVTFSSPLSAGTGLALGTLGPGQSRAVWVKRTVNVAAAAANDGFTLRTQGETLP